MGLLEGHLGVNWPLFARIFLGWIITIVVVGIMSGFLFAFGAFAPSIQQSHILTLWREWAGGFSEGVRQAYLVNNPDALFVDIGTEQVQLKTDASVDVRSDEWPSIYINQLELLTNIKDGLQSYKFEDFSNHFDGELPQGPLDKALDILNVALRT